jgi:hypothetical protein
LNDKFTSEIQPSKYADENCGHNQKFTVPLCRTYSPLFCVQKNEKMKRWVVRAVRVDFSTDKQNEKRNVNKSKLLLTTSLQQQQQQQQQLQLSLSI